LILSLPEDTMAEACRRFREKIKTVVEAAGDFDK
jgi:hypothetical protein